MICENVALFQTTHIKLRAYLFSCKMKNLSRVCHTQKCVAAAIHQKKIRREIFRWVSDFFTERKNHHFLPTNSPYIIFCRQILAGVPFFAGKYPMSFDHICVLFVDNFICTIYIHIQLGHTYTHTRHYIYPWWIGKEDGSLVRVSFACFIPPSI